MPSQQNRLSNFSQKLWESLTKKVGHFKIDQQQAGPTYRNPPSKIRFSRFDCGGLQGLADSACGVFAAGVVDDVHDFVEVSLAFV